MRGVRWWWWWWWWWCVCVFSCVAAIEFPFSCSSSYVTCLRSSHRLRMLLLLTCFFGRWLCLPPCPLFSRLAWPPGARRGPPLCVGLGAGLSSWGWGGAMSSSFLLLPLAIFLLVETHSLLPLPPFPIPSPEPATASMKQIVSSCTLLGRARALLGFVKDLLGVAHHEGVEDRARTCALVAGTE